MATIRVFEQIGDRAIDMKQGDQICQLIVEAFQKSEKVVVDFSGMKTILSTFLNNAIGALYKNYTSDFLNRSLKLENLCEDDLFIVKRVTKRAREFYQNQEKIEGVLNERIIKRSDEYKDILQELRIIFFRQICPVFTLLASNFPQISLEGVFDCPDTFDFNDRYYGLVAKHEGAYIVTNDADFSDVPDVDIITNNAALLHPHSS